VPPERRGALFRCVIAMAGPDGLLFTVEGRCPGRILEAPRGTGGFGYDPVFYYPPAGKSFAEMDPAEKNRISHRGHALAAFAAELRARLADGRLRA
jgi:XTP/dITP diphosphohydrolase